MDYSIVPIKIVSVPTDLLTIFSSFVAALLGAYAAFSLGIFRENLRRRESKLVAINVSIYGLLMSAEILLNFKRQFLVEFEKEFSSILIALGKLPSRSGLEDLDTAVLSVSQMFSDVEKKDRTLNSIFKNWQILEFPLMPSPKELAFTVGGAPELMRLILIAGVETEQIRRRIQNRNEKVRELSFSVIDHNSSDQEKLTRVQLWFELLDLRRLLREHVDTALVVITEALDELQRYRMEYLPRRNKLATKIFGREIWTSYSIPPEWRKYLPDKQAYRHILKL